jgi:predicted NUDIX family NTP pyrophosphohydrolase
LETWRSAAAGLASGHLVVVLVKEGMTKDVCQVKANTFKCACKPRHARLEGFSTCPRILWKALWITCAQQAARLLEQGFASIGCFLIKRISRLLAPGRAGMLCGR